MKTIETMNSFEVSRTLKIAHKAFDNGHYGMATEIANCQMRLHELGYTWEQIEDFEYSERLAIR